MILCLVVAVLVLLLCALLPLTLMQIYLAVKRLVLHNLLNQIRAFVFNNYIYIYIKMSNYIKNAPTCFGASAPSSGRSDIVFGKVI